MSAVVEAGNQYALAMELSTSGNILRERHFKQMGCEVDPVSSQRVAQQEFNLAEVDWDHAQWESCPALQNLAMLSPMSRWDMPTTRFHDQPSSHVPILRKETEPLADLSPESERVPMLRNVVVDRKQDLAHVEPSQMLKDMRPAENVCKAITTQTQLLGLSDRALQDEKLSELVSVVAEANSRDTNLLRLIASRNVRVKPTGRHELLKEKGIRPPQVPNRAFDDSDIVRYPDLTEWAEPQPTLHERNSDGYRTWFDKATDYGSAADDPAAYDAYRERLTSMQGYYDALVDRIDRLSPERRAAAANEKLAVKTAASSAVLSRETESVATTRDETADHEPTSSVVQLPTV